MKVLTISANYNEQSASKLQSDDNERRRHRLRKIYVWVGLVLLLLGIIALACTLPVCIITKGCAPIKTSSQQAGELFAAFVVYALRELIYKQSPRTAI